MPLMYRSSPVPDLDPVTLYRILQLRVRVFVVEQACAYDELDGRDLEPDALLFWAESDGDVVGTLRLLVDGEALRIGRVATSREARGQGVAAELIARALAACSARCPGRAVVLDAQAHLADWYARFGFLVSGDRFVEDGIPHVPMVLRPVASQN